MAQRGIVSDMLDDATTGSSTSLPRCMWCSAPLPSESETTCPTCGATLVGDGESQVPGVTAIDAEAIIRAGREPKPQRRSRLMSWISGEYPEEDKPAPPGSLAPPPLEVRREMLRLELEAEVANLQAEAGVIAAEEAVEAVDAGESPEAAAAGAAATVAAVSNAAAAVTPELDGSGTAGSVGAPAAGAADGGDVVAAAADADVDETTA
jgi:hypothetical protein